MSVEQNKALVRRLYESGFDEIMRGRRLFTSVAATAVTVLMLLLTSSPAYAYSSAHHGSDYVQTYGSNYSLVEVCDMESDGHGVWADVYDNRWNYYAGLLDGNGSKSPATFTASRMGSTNSGYANVMSLARAGMLHRPG